MFRAIQSIAAPTLVCDASGGHEGSSFNVTVAYIPLWPFRKSQSCPLFVLEWSHQQNFTAQSILSFVKEDAAFSWIQNEQITTEVANLECLKQITKFKKQISWKCKEVINGRKKKKKKIGIFDY